MGNRVTFELGADLDASVTNAAKRFHDAMKATADMFPGMNMQAKIVGDTMRLTLTESKQKLTQLTTSLKEHAVRTKTATEEIGLMAKANRNNQLMMFESIRVVQDFTQVVGQTGLAGGIRASANNIQRLAELFALAVPGFGMAKLALISLGTAALVPVADWLFGVKKNADDAKTSLDALATTQKEVVGLVKPTDRDKLIQEDMRLRGALQAADAAVGAKRNALAAAEDTSGGWLSRLGEALKPGPDYEKMTGKSKERAENSAIGWLARKLSGKEEEAQARYDLDVAEREASRLRAQVADTAKKLERQRRYDATEERGRAASQAAGMPAKWRAEFLERFQMPFAAADEDLAMERARFQERRSTAEAAADPRRGLDRRSKAAFDAEAKQIEVKEREKRIRDLDNQERAAKAAEGMQALMTQATIYALRLPIVPIPNLHR